MVVTSAAPRPWTRFVTPALLSIGLVLIARALFIAQAHRVPLQAILGLRFQGLMFGLVVAVALVVWATVRELRDLRDARPRSSVAAPVRWLFVVAVGGWLLFVGFVQPFQRIWFDLALGAAAGAWALVPLVQRAASRGPSARLCRALDIVAFGLCAAALGLELSLRVWANVRPAPLNARVGAGPGELIRRFRCEPGLVHFGFECNSRGFYDTEFFRKDAADNEPLIVAIGDSFNVGAVPHAWHFTSICEELIGARIYNMGVPGIGPAEYVSLLVNEALPLDPDLILIGIFLGNDLNVLDVVEDLPDAALRAWFQRDQVLLFVLPERLSRVRAERIVREKRGTAVVQGEPAARPMNREEATAAFPWVVDPDLEEATYSAETFYRVETSRALDICARTPYSFDLFCRSMLAAKRAAGETPLQVMLIPDEFQVEDALWEIVRKRAGRELDRTRPQRLLTAWLAEQDIPCLDLLPILRQIPLESDGKRHLYHKQDTHFNARGNQITAQALAEFLRRE